MTARLRYPTSMGTAMRVMLPTIAKIPSQTPRQSLMMRRTLRRRSIPKKKSRKDKRKKHSSHNKNSKAEEEEEEEEEELEEPEVPFKQQLQKVRYKKFLKDTDEANYIKGVLLGLGPGVIPSQKQIDQSKLFLEQPSDKTALGADVSNAWMPILEDRLWLAVEAPDRMKHKDGTAPIYKFKDLQRLVPSAAGAWTAKNAKPALVAVIPPPPRLPWRLPLVWKAYIPWPPYAR